MLVLLSGAWIRFRAVGLRVVPAHFAFSGVGRVRLHLFATAVRAMMGGGTGMGHASAEGQACEEASEKDEEGRAQGFHAVTLSLRAHGPPTMHCPSLFIFTSHYGGLVRSMSTPVIQGVVS